MLKLGQNLRLNLEIISLICIVNAKFCKHYYSETKKRSSLISKWKYENLYLTVCLPVYLLVKN